MFLKYKARMLDDPAWDHTRRARLYAQYASAPEVAHNTYVDDPAVKEALRREAIGGRTAADFDDEYYRASNYDLASLSQSELWRHFHDDGCLEARPFRWRSGGGRSDK